jgi:hypothetical protein
MTLLPPEHLTNFSAVFFSSSAVRGPLVFHKNGEWIKEFRKLIDIKDVGMAGPTVGCQERPHVQTHFFVVRSGIIPHILSDLQNYQALTTPWVSMLDYFRTEMSASVVRAGYQLSSRMTHTRLQQQVMDVNCTRGNSEFSIPYSRAWDYRSWCEVDPQEVIFMRWGGESVYNPVSDRYMCEKQIDMSDRALVKMEDTMLDVASSTTDVSFIFPESPYGGLLYDLFKQYRNEMWRERQNHIADSNLSNKRLSPVSSGAGQAEDSDVCFLVRTSTRDDPNRAVRSKPEMNDMDLASLIQCTRF